MRDTVMYGLAIVPCSICLYFGGVLCASGSSYWGWFLFVAVLLTPTFRRK